jgi:hypothetical protein
MKPTSSHPPAAPARHGHHDPAELDNADVDHEHSDINIRAVLGFALGLAIVTGVVFLLMWGLFVGLENNAASRDPQLSPHAVPAGQLPPEPRLLTNEPVVLRDMRDKETATLQGYGWVDQGAGVARIPIEEAKKKIVERGLPSRADAVSDPRFGTSAPAMGESSAGRVLGSRAPQGPQQPASAPAPQPAAEHKGH